MVAAPFASAAPINLTFELFAYGTQINNYYNGGKDSLGRNGYENFGLSFSGGSIKYTPSGGYLSGPVNLTINPDIVRALLGSDRYYITFNAAKYSVDYGVVTATYESGFSEPSQYVNGNGNPYCPSQPDACDYPVYHGTMGGYYIPGGTQNGYNDMVTSIGFNTDRLDNIQIRAYDGQGIVVPGRITDTYENGRDVPEPATLALFGAGAAALLARRRRNKKAL